MVIGTVTATVALVEVLARYVKVVVMTLFRITLGGMVVLIRIRFTDMSLMVVLMVRLAGILFSSRLMSAVLMRGRLKPR